MCFRKPMNTESLPYPAAPQLRLAQSPTPHHRRPYARGTSCLTQQPGDSAYLFISGLDVSSMFANLFLARAWRRNEDPRQRRAPQGREHAGEFVAELREPRTRARESTNAPRPGPTTG